MCGNDLEIKPDDIVWHSILGNTGSLDNPDGNVGKFLYWDNLQIPLPLSYSVLWSSGFYNAAPTSNFGKKR